MGFVFLLLRKFSFLMLHSTSSSLYGLLLMCEHELRRVHHTSNFSKWQILHYIPLRKSGLPPHPPKCRSFRLKKEAHIPYRLRVVPERYAFVIN